MTVEEGKGRMGFNSRFRREDMDRNLYNAKRQGPSYLSAASASQGGNAV